MLRVFVDSSVLFPAFHSNSGYAHDLIRLSLSWQLTIIVTPYVVDETKRILQRKSAPNDTLFQQFLLIGSVEIVEEAHDDLLLVVAEYVVAKDVPIVAAAIQSGVDYLVTYDKRHILREDVIERSDLHICVPEEVVTIISKS